MSCCRATDRTCRLCDFKEVHLTSKSFLKAIFEGVYRRCIDVLLGKSVPSIYNPLRKEVQSSITTTIYLRQFPAVPSGYSAFRLVKEAWLRSRAFIYVYAIWRGKTAKSSAITSAEANALLILPQLAFFYKQTYGDAIINRRTMHCVTVCWWCWCII